jgi:hypothetical protein
VGTFSTKLRDQIPNAHTRQELRRQLPPNILVQFLAGPGDVCRGVFGWLLKGIAWISLVIAPGGPWQSLDRKRGAIGA